MSKETLTSRKVMYNGTHGNTAKEVLKAILAADPAATEFNMGTVPAGIEIVDLDVVTEALGVGTNVDIGYRYVDSDNGTDDPDYFGNFATASAGRLRTSAAPIMFEDEVQIVATILGGAGTGTLMVIPEGITRGVR